MAIKIATRWLEILSAAWWAFALTATGLMLIFAPIANQYPGPDGCYFTSDLIFHISCNGTWNDEIIGGLLSWAFYWTFQSPIMLMLAVAAPNSIFGLGFIPLWTSSLLLAFSLLIRQALKLRRKPKANAFS